MLVASPAFAAQVSKFRGSNGEVSFMDINVGNDGAAQQDGTYECAEVAPANIPSRGNR